MLLNFNELNAKERIHYMYHTIVPRPIAWIVTENEGVNIAPFSFFNAVSSNPPMLMVAIGEKRDGSPKDTLRNLREKKTCVVHMVAPEQIEAMHSSAAMLGFGESEAEVFNIPTKTMLDNYPPVIERAPAAFFCTYHSEHAINESKITPVFLEITHYYLDDAIKEHHKPFDLDLLARMGQAYGRVNELIEVPESKK